MDFKDLKELVSFLTKNKAKNIEVLGNMGSDEASLLNSLYEGITKGRYDSDFDAAADIYKAGPRDKKYVKLKNRLIKLLVNTTFFLDSNETQYSDYSKAYFSCFRDYTAAYFLFRIGVFGPSVSLLHQTLEPAMHFEFTDLVSNIARLLRRYYSVVSIDPGLYKKMSDLHRDWEKKRSYEMEALENYEFVISHYMTGRSTSQEVYNHTSEVFPGLFSKLKEVDTMMYYFWVYNIGLAMYMSVNDARNALIVCNEALEILPKQRYQTSNSIVLFALNKLVCMTQLKMYDSNEADEILSFCFTNSNAGHQDWYQIKMVQCSHYLHAKRYQDALNVYSDVISQLNFGAQSTSNAENWYLTAGYFHLLASFGLLNTFEVNKIVGEYKQTRFENQFAVLSKEKVGMNIPIEILPELMLLVEGKYGDNINSFDNLEKYRQRYLDEGANKRSNIFMKMIFALSKWPYDKDRVGRRIEKLVEELRNEPLEDAGQSYAIEVIPYEELWALLKAKLNYSAP